jgi:hypothetical protein
MGRGDAMDKKDTKEKGEERLKAVDHNSDRSEKVSPSPVVSVHIYLHDNN